MAILPLPLGRRLDQSLTERNILPDNDPSIGQSPLNLESDLSGEIQGEIQETPKAMKESDIKFFELAQGIASCLDNLPRRRIRSDIGQKKQRISHSLNQ
jgi:hypothetical protein